MTEVNVKRGSHKLLAELSKKGMNATPEDIGAALALPRESGFTTRRYFPRGVLPFYEVDATLFGPVSELGATINQLATHGSLRGINILINGVVNPEIAEVTVKLAGNTQ